MGIEEQLRAYALELRDRGVPREQATAMLRARRQQLEAGQAQQTPQRPAPRAEDSEGLSLSQYARLAGQGLTFGFSDELEAAFRGGLAALPGGRSPREAARETLEAAREDVERAYEQRPKTAFATEVASGIIPAVLAAVPTGGGSIGARAAAMAPRAARLAQAARANPIRGGMAYGALSGVGAGEGAEERLAGGVIGSALGGAFGGTARAISGLAGLVSNSLESRAVQARARQLLAEATEKGEALTESEALRRAVLDIRPERATREGMESVAEAVRASGYTPEQLRELAEPVGPLREAATMLEVPTASELETAGMGIFPIKAGATPLQRMGRGLAVSGDAEGQLINQAIARRSIGRNERLRRAFVRNSRVNARAYAEVAQELEGNLRKNAAENYRAAYERSVPTSSIREFLDRPEQFNWFEKFYNQARAEAAAQVIEKKPGATLLPALYEEIETPDGVIKKFTEEIPVKALDYIKRAMDDVVLASRTGGQDFVPAERAATWRFGLNRLLEKADKAVPEYANARRIYKSDADVQRAFDAAFSGGEVYIPSPRGNSLNASTAVKLKPFVNESPRRVSEFLENPNVSEAEKYRYVQGALENLFETVSTTPDARDLSSKLLGSPGQREKMRILLGGDEEVQRMLQEALPEAVLARSANQILGGSTTAEKFRDAISAGGRTFEALTALFTGAPMLGLRIVAQQVFDRLLAGRFFRGLAQARRAVQSEALTMTPTQFAEEYAKTTGQTISRVRASAILDAIQKSGAGVSIRETAREF